jgi:hypothetical protein
MHHQHQEKSFQISQLFTIITIAFGQRYENAWKFSYEQEKVSKKIKVE